MAPSTLNRSTSAPTSGLAIGLMSGTSGDGIDAALVRFTESAAATFPRMELVDSYYVPYTAAQRAQVFQLFQPDVPARYVARMDAQMGRWFGEAAAALMQRAGVDAGDVAVIGSHGQTVYHAPDEATTLQIGDPAAIAAATGCPVVSDLRRGDIAAGGQGAPLVPYFDYGYFSADDRTRVVLNIGGISNITVLPRGAEMDAIVAYDTGPGNMLIDALAQVLSDGALAYDKDGRLAAGGTAASGVIGQWIEQDAYVQRPGPKSTGREQYGAEFLEKYQRDMTGLSVVDQMATMTEFVARTVAMGIRMAVKGDFELIVSGGGRHNRALISGIERFAEPVRTVWPDEQGVPSDMKEAMAFALFAWQHLHGRPTNVPSATGASRPVVLGQWTPRPIR